MAECKYEGCERAVRIKRYNLCSGHAQQIYRGEELHPLRLREFWEEGKTSRECRKCHTEKPVKDFYKDQNGHPRSYCKRCMIDMQNERNKRRAEQEKKNALRDALTVDRG